MTDDADGGGNPGQRPEIADSRLRWALEPGVTYLNHGSFGPPPRAVTQARDRWSRRLNANPMDFFTRQMGSLLTDARSRLAAFVGAEADGLVFAENATTAMNVVADSFALAPGDEVLTTDHDYGAVHRIWQRACERAGARLVIQQIPVPFQTADDVVAAVLSGVTGRTRLLVFSHITSPTAIIFPARQLCQAARQRGLAVCIDGPHAIGMLPTEIELLDCDFYTASCHKWLSAPFSSGFLFVHPRRQAQLRPPVLSWGRALAGEAATWRDEFNWVGTRDPAAYLAVPDAIEFLERFGFPAFRRRTHELVRLARTRIEQLTCLAALVPDDSAWYGSMIALPLPPGPCEPLQAALWERFRIEVPIVDWQGMRLVRVSCHLYNNEGDIDRLVGALAELLGQN
jgi:isopenicillin-N epimerase